MVRRPTPLPPPPGAEQPRAAAPRPPEPVIADEAETAPIAPLLTLPEPVDDERVQERADPEQQLGLGDLWRASRARRRALRAEVRRFTARSRRRRRIWVGVVASLLLLVLVTVGAAYSPLFAVEQIQVVGTSQLDPKTVEDALAGQLGSPLAAVDESAVKAAMVAFPLVESYTLEAVPPHELVVRIVERTPIGVLQSAAGFTLVDAAGVALSTTPTAPAGYPLLSIAGGVGSDEFAAAGRVMRALPAELRATVTGVSASTPDDVTLTLGGTKVVWGSADRSALKSLVLQKSMAARPGAASYDVSSPDAVVIR